MPDHLPTSLPASLERACGAAIDVCGFLPHLDRLLEEGESPRLEQVLQNLHSSHWEFHRSFMDPAVGDLLAEANNLRTAEFADVVDTSYTGIAFGYLSSVLIRGGWGVGGIPETFDEFLHKIEQHGYKRVASAHRKILGGIDLRPLAAEIEAEYRRAIACLDRKVTVKKIGVSLAPQPTKKKRGRDRADDETIEAEQEMVEEWERYKATGSKAEFSRDHGTTLKDLNRLLDRVRKRK